MHIKNPFLYLNVNATFKIEMTNLFNSTYLSCNSNKKGILGIYSLMNSGGVMMRT